MGQLKPRRSDVGYSSDKSYPAISRIHELRLFAHDVAWHDRISSHCIASPTWATSCRPNSITYVTTLDRPHHIACIAPHHSYRIANIAPPTSWHTESHRLHRLHSITRTVFVLTFNCCKLLQSAKTQHLTTCFMNWNKSAYRKICCQTF